MSLSVALYKVLLLIKIASFISHYQLLKSILLGHPEGRPLHEV